MDNQISISEKEFLAALPPKLKGGISQTAIDKIRNTLSEPETFELLRDNLIGYTGVMQNGKFSVEQYIDAVRYVSYKLMGASNLQAYKKTHSDRYLAMVEKGVLTKDISSIVAAYNKNKLVNLIYEQTLIPTWVLNADIYQKAINVQSAIMNDKNVSPKVRSDAANSVLTHLKRPETSRIQLDITAKEDSALADLRASTRELIEHQRKLIASKGLSAHDVAESELVVEADFQEID